MPSIFKKDKEKKDQRLRCYGCNDVIGERFHAPARKVVLRTGKQYIHADPKCQNKALGRAKAEAEA